MREENATNASVRKSGDDWKWNWMKHTVNWKSASACVWIGYYVYVCDCPWVCVLVCICVCMWVVTPGGQAATSVAGKVTRDAFCWRRCCYCLPFDTHKHTQTHTHTRTLIYTQALSQTFKFRRSGNAVVECERDSNIFKCNQLFKVSSQALA